MLDTSVIPKGDYCYSGKYCCPYWKYRHEIDNVEVHNQNDGYCLFLGMGDVEMNGERTYTLSNPKDHPDYGIPMTADEIGLPLSLLWDQVKMCGENNYTDDELKELYKEWNTD